MSLDLEHELRLAMQEFTDDVLAPPDLLSGLRRSRHRAFPRLAVVAAAVAAAVTIAGVVVVGEHTGGGGGTAVTPLSTYRLKADFGAVQDRMARALNAAVDRWGATRGDRANDAQLMTRLQTEWTHPSAHPTNLGSFEPVRSPDGPVRILWAGSTPDGVAALAVQRTKDPVANYVYGIFLTGTDGKPHLAQRAQLIGGTDFGDNDPYALSFTTSTAHHAVVVVPTDSADGVRVAFSTKADAAGRLVPQWQTVAVRNGAALASVPATGNVWETVVEVSHGGTVVADHRLDFVATHLINEGPPQPANLLGMWCNGCVVGGSSGPGYTMATVLAWLVRHGPDYLPAYWASWSLGATLPDGTAVVATQMWVPGNDARTVVIAADSRDSAVQVLYDEKTDPAQRPVVAVRLPQSAGWMVGAGPDAVVTGWRTSDGASWHAVRSKKALLVPTDASSIQLQLVVSGHQQVVTR